LLNRQLRLYIRSKKGYVVKATKDSDILM